MRRATPEFSGKLEEPGFWIRGKDDIMECKKDTLVGALGQAVPLHSSHLSCLHIKVTFLIITSLSGALASPSSEQVISKLPQKVHRCWFLAEVWLRKKKKKKKSLAFSAHIVPGIIREEKPRGSPRNSPQTFIHLETRIFQLRGKEVAANYDEVTPQGNPKPRGFAWLENFKYSNKVLHASFLHFHLIFLLFILFSI